MSSSYENDIFISYSHEDKKIVKTIVEELREFGLSVFWSEKLPRGGPFPAKLAREVVGSKYFAVYWSDAAAVSKWVEAEAGLFWGQCHVKDSENRLMFVCLADSLKEADLPPYLSNVNCSVSVDAMVMDIARTAFQSLTKKSDFTVAQLEQETQKVRAAQGCYRHNRFWEPISSNRDIHIFTCARDVQLNPATMRGSGGRTNIDMWDYRAVLDITHFFASNHPHAQVTIEDPMRKLNDNDLQDSVSLAEHMGTIRNKLEDHDCIIIGSPDVSDIAELVLAKIHGVRPYAENRVLNKGFVVIKDRQCTRSSFYWAQSENEQEGVAQVIGPEKYEYFDHKPVGKDGSYGVMHGILTVANNPFCVDGEHRKIIILSGFSGLATNALSKFLTEDACLDEFFKLDNEYTNLTQDIEVLIAVKYISDKGVAYGDTRRILDSPDAITCEKIVEV